MSTPALITLRDVRAGYDGVEVLHGIDLRITAGETVAVLGPNGAGKSTLISVLSGLLTPTGGDISFGGRSAAGLSASQLASHGLCCIPEGRGVFANLTVSDNLWLAAGSRRARSPATDRVFDLFPRLAERRTQLAGSLSGGEQQMLALARAFVTDPAILIVDELSMGLAPKIVADLYGRVAELAGEGTTMILVEQFVNSVAAIASRGIVLSSGRVVLDGPIETIIPRLGATYFATSEESEQ